MNQRTTSNRTAFYVVIGLAIIMILCSLVTRAVGWPRFCGGSLILVGALLVLTSEEKGWPLAILIIGLGLFFWDVIVAFSAGM